MDTLTTQYLRLFHHPEFGSATLSKLLASLGSLHKIQQASAAQLATLGLSRRQQSILHASDDVTEAQVEADLSWSAQSQNDLITYDDPTYPVLLKLISRPPPLLYIRGNPAVLGLHQLAVVGSRNATAGGRHHALTLAADLARRGFCICSGMARGIDTQAHRGALEVNAPTVAVLGTGVDVVYPASNRQLAQQIEQQGALVSEFPLGTPPLAAHFPQRNRIISGMSLGVLVVEATAASGSLITAYHALEQQREVFALPGSISNPQAKGCHDLIRQGAKLVDSVDCIVAELDPLAQVQRSAMNTIYQSLSIGPECSTESEMSEQARQVLQALGYEERSPDALLRDSGLDLPTLSSSLVELELLGLVEQSGGRYRRTR